MNAPIALFVYARPDHARRTVEALLNNPEAVDTDLIVFSDAAKTPNKSAAVEEVRCYVDSIQGFRSVTVYRRLFNFGLAKSIIEGVTQVFGEHDSVIVLEDDMITSPHFLAYMNDGLSRYANDDRVVSLHGYMYPVSDPLPEAFFLRGADCWGWATWRRGWAYFNPDGQFLLDELARMNLVKEFDFDGAYSFSRMLRGQVKGRNDSWAVRWHASAFLANKLTLYPGRSLVHNIGNDSSGKHCVTSSTYDVVLSDTPICMDNLVVEESADAKKAIKYFFRMRRRPINNLLTNLIPNAQRRIITLIEDCLPPVLIRLLRRLLRSVVGMGISVYGPFESWEEAQKRSSGYDQGQILEKVLAATLQVKRGEAIYERDSVLFDNIQYSWPITAGLMWAAARDHGRLSVLDFGGSLGSSYFQNLKFLGDLQNVRWSVVEQPHFVEAGRAHVQNETLVFYPTIMECVAAENPNVLLLSSVLQYLERPFAVLDELIGSGVEIILVDRTSLSTNGDVFKIQVTPKNICSSRYPIRYFDRTKLISFFNRKGFCCVEEFSSLDNFDSGAVWKGFLFKNKSIP